MTKVLSMYLSHKWGGVCGRAKGLAFNLFHKQVDSEGADGATYGSTMNLFVILTLEEEVCVFKAELQ